MVQRFKAVIIASLALAACAPGPAARAGDGPDRLPEAISQSAPTSFPAQFQYDEPPKPLVTSAPVYPFDLLTQKVRGNATVTFAVDESGRTHLVKTVSASRPEFGAAAAAMIQAWSFDPARRKGGKPSWALLRKDRVFSRSPEDFPLNDSAERLLRDVGRTPWPVLKDARSPDAPLKGRFQPAPVVPDALLASQGGAQAVVEFVVDHTGDAQLPRIVSSTDPDFGWAAATAVGRWQFTIPTKAGKPVDVIVRVPLVYNSQNPPSAGS